MAEKNFRKVLLILLALLLVLSLLYLALGDKNIALSQLFQSQIVRDLRLPRLLALYFVGVLLSISGFLVQTMTRNPIAEMATLGISGGASLALALVLTLGLSTADWLSSLIASLGAFVALLVVMLFTAKSHFQSLKVVLVGTSIGLFTTSLASSLTFASNQTQSYFLWIIGSFSAVTKLKVEILGISLLVFLVLIFIFGNQLKLLAFSDEIVISLGVSVNRLRLLVMLLVALASGVTVSAVGVISFVGLIAPHISRRFMGHHAFWRNLLISSLLGMNLLTLADLLARNLFKPFEFPAGCLTMLLGAPFFISIISREAK